MKKRVVVLSGAGMSAESGLKTFRDADGLWEGHDVMSVASPEGWQRDRSLVLQFYNERRRQLQSVDPNAGHRALAKLAEHYDVSIVTQNVDDLHERAGSRQVLHLHGELLGMRSTGNPNYIVPCHDDINLGDTCPEGHQLRPNIVWFGEAVPMISIAVEVIRDADLVIIVGTSLQVYPAAGLVGHAPTTADIFYIDPRPSSNYELARLRELKIIEDTAANALPDLVDELLQRNQKGT